MAEVLAGDTGLPRRWDREGRNDVGDGARGRRAYDAPFPDESFKEGARQFPCSCRPLPTIPPPPPTAPRGTCCAWKKPCLTAFSDSDAITRGGERVFQSQVPGAAGREHPTIAGAGHFLQEDAGPELARVVADFIATT